MTIQVEAIYENGVLRPVRDIPLYEEERVTLTIEPQSDDLDHEYLAQCQAEVAKSSKPVLTPEELQELLKHDKSSWADLIIQERGEY
jgi:predicted DNA-binding antitoxin AbrB/MazE fold protein